MHRSWTPHSDWLTDSSYPGILLFFWCARVLSSRRRSMVRANRRGPHKPVGYWWLSYLCTYGVHYVCLVVRNTRNTEVVDGNEAFTGQSAIRVQSRTQNELRAGACNATFVWSSDRLTSATDWCEQPRPKE